MTKLIKIAWYAILYLILCLIIIPIIVNILSALINIPIIATVLGKIISILLAFQISARINRVTQVFPNYLKTLNIKVNKPNLVQAGLYVVYFTGIAIISMLKNEMLTVLIILTLCKLLLTYTIANIVRMVVRQKPKYQ